MGEENKADKDWLEGFEANFAFEANYEAKW